MYNVFISCKSEDYDKAKDVYNWLINQGYSPFFADISLKGNYAPGKSAVFGKEVDKALEEVDNMIVLASKAEFTTSKYVEEEWRLFVEEQRAGRKSGNIITILEGVAVADLPIKLRNVQSFTLNNYKNGLLGYLPKREAVIEKGNSNKEQEQKAREEREKLRRELEIERARRIEEEKRRRVSEQERVWLEHKLKADKQSTAKENNKKKMRKTPPPKPVPQWWIWVKRHILLITILLLLVVLGIVLMKGGMLPTRKIVAPVDTVVQSTEEGDTVKEAMLHQLSAQEQPVIQTASRVEQKQEEPVQKSSSSVSVRQEKGNLLFTVNGVEFKMVKVEGGTFWMEEYSWEDENPRLKVTLSDYYIGETVVTQGLWKAVTGDNPSRFRGDDLPVESVSWDDAQEFIARLNKETGQKFRLPTEAEWEYAARGGKKSKGYKYSGSNNIDKVAWYHDNSGVDKTHPVKKKSANELGLYDMSGNVWEWCEDEWHRYISDTHIEGAVILDRVLRGGSWLDDDAGNCSVSSRDRIVHSIRSCSIGFRLVMCP